MSEQVVSSECLICRQPIPKGLAIFVDVVNLTDKPYGRFFPKKPKAGHLRLQHRGSAKPRGVVHEICWNIGFARGFVHSLNVKL